jgi:hypothetical protein
MTAILLPVSVEFYGPYDEDDEEQVFDQIDRNRVRLAAMNLRLVAEINRCSDSHQELWADDGSLTIRGAISVEILKDGEKIEPSDFDIWG